MSLSKLISEGNLEKIKKVAGDIMDSKIKDSLSTKIVKAKKEIGARLASQSIRYK